MKTNIRYLSYLAQFFLKRELFQMNLRKQFKTQTSCSITCLENCVVYVVMRKSNAQPDRPQITI
jgi:hypothetical protein